MGWAIALTVLALTAFAVARALGRARSTFDRLVDLDETMAFEVLPVSSSVPRGHGMQAAA